MWRNSVARGGGEGQNGESRGMPASMLGFEIKTIFPQGQTPIPFSVEIYGFRGKGIGFFSSEIGCEGKKDNLAAIFSPTLFGGDGLVFLIPTVAYSLDEQRVQLVNKASDQPFVHPFRLTDGVSFSQGEALRQFLQQDASLQGAGQFGSAFRCGAAASGAGGCVRGKSRRWASAALKCSSRPPSPSRSSLPHRWR